MIRVTQCISTQVGCAMGCVFCASGVAGLKRNLGADEIVAQVIAGRARLDAGERLRNVVFMGMGEPLANYAATARSLRLLTHTDGIGLSARRITVSTSGLVPQDQRASVKTSTATSAWPFRCMPQMTRRGRVSCPSTRSTHCLRSSWPPSGPTRFRVVRQNHHRIHVGRREKRRPEGSRRSLQSSS